MGPNRWPEISGGDLSVNWLFKPLQYFLADAKQRGKDNLALPMTDTHHIISISNIIENNTYYICKQSSIEIIAISSIFFCTLASCKSNGLYLYVFKEIKVFDR